MPGMDTSDILRRSCILVTGATGYTGNKLVDVLLERGFTVRALVRDKNRLRHNKRVEIFQGDLTEPESLSGISDNIHSVIHCAGALGKWGVDKSELYKVNVQGSINLLNQFAGKSLYRFVHLSAGGVTGPVTEKPVDETYNCRPVTSYEKIKYLAEQKIFEMSEQMDIPTIVLRPTFVFGPGDPHKLSLFKAVKKRRFAFIGNGKSLNSPVYIDDVINGIILALEKGRLGEVYIIGGERPVTKQELVYTIADTLEVGRPYIKIPRRIAWFSALGFECLGHIFGFEPILTRSRIRMMSDNYGYSSQKAIRELDYEQKVEFKDGIARTIKDYNENGLL